MKKIYYKTEKDLASIYEAIKRNEANTAKEGAGVTDIIYNVRKKGDEAVFAYTKKFDGFDMNKENIRINESEIKAAYADISDELLGIIKRAFARISDFHMNQKQKSWIEPYKNGEILGQMIRPLESVGVYVPGGKAAYPSTVLMNIIPAKIAGVERIIMTTPPDASGKINPATIVAACEAGVTEIYKVGGAQAVAGLAFGTECIPKVCKIVGPGNIYVALAKKAVFGYVNIDSIAGPSEILIVADETANPKFVAADMLSQAEHDEMASALLVTTSEELADCVIAELKTQTAALSRKEIIEKSLSNHSAVVITSDLADAMKIANEIAPEHMELCINNPFEALSGVQNAGAVFLGNYTPEPLGDYMAGPNHVLPTSGTAKFFSPLSVDDFVKKTSVLSFTKDAFTALSSDVIGFAKSEGLTAHANSVAVRLGVSI